MNSKNNPWDEIDTATKETDTETSSIKNEMDNTSDLENNSNITEENINYTPTFRVNLSQLSSSSNSNDWILKPGEYPAKITRYQKGIHEDNGGKLGRCPQVTVYFTVTNENTIDCRKTFYLTDVDWAKYQMFYLFRACGLTDHGKFSCDWESLLGNMVIITVDDSKNENTGKIYHNNITRIKPYKDDSAFTEDDLPF